jgi:hypothetical protein
MRDIGELKLNKKKLKEIIVQQKKGNKGKFLYLFFYIIAYLLKEEAKLVKID